MVVLAITGRRTCQCWQHKGTMSTKPVFEKIAKIQRLYVPLCGHTTFVLLTLARSMTIIDKIMIFCNDVNKTSTFIELLSINILLLLFYFILFF